MQELKDLFIFLNTKQLGNMYFGSPKETPMKATLQVRNDCGENIEELKISIEAFDIKNRAKVFFEEYTIALLSSKEISYYEVDFSKIKIYGVFEVTVKAVNSEKEAVYKTKIARVVEAEKQDDFLAINTHIAAHAGEIMDKGVELVKKAGCGWILDDLQWWQCETEKGNFHIPETYRIFAEKCKEAGLRVRYNMDDRGIQNIYDDADTWHSITDEQLKHFTEYCAKVAREFKGLGYAYEICSEWDHQCKARKCESTHTPEAYAKIIKASSRAIKAEDPDATILSVGNARCNVKWVRRALEAGAGDAIDALAIHPYHYYLFPVSPAYTCTQSWMNTLDQFKAYEELSREYCGGIPIWNTESGWSSCEENVDGCTEIQQAAYTLQLYLLSKCAKLVNKMTIYKLSDGGHNTKDYEQMLGIVGVATPQFEGDVDHLVKPAYCVMPVAANLLSDIEFEKQVCIHDNLVIYQYRNSKGKYLTAFFTLEELCGDVSVSCSEFTENDVAYDMFSNKIKPKLQDGKMVFFASDYPVMLFTDKPIVDISFGNLQNVKDIPENITDLFAII